MDATAPFTPLVIANRSSGAETLARRLPRARVAAAFNTVPSEVLISVFEAPAWAEGRAMALEQAIELALGEAAG